MFNLSGISTKGSPKDILVICCSDWGGGGSEKCADRHCTKCPKHPNVLAMLRILRDFSEHLITMSESQIDYLGFFCFCSFCFFVKLTFFLMNLFLQVLFCFACFFNFLRIVQTA